MVTEQNIIDRMGQEKVNNYANDRQKSSFSIVTMCLNSSKLFVEALCNRFAKEYDEDNKFQIEAITLFGIGEIYDYSNATDDNGNKLNGKDEKEQAETILVNSWSVQDEKVIIRKPYAGVTQSTGARDLSELEY